MNAIVQGSEKMKHRQEKLLGSNAQAVAEKMPMQAKSNLELGS
jgi:hypothetical protein